MMNDKVFNDNMSMMSSQRVVLKISCENTTKRVRDLPETFEVLKQQVKTAVSKGNQEFIKKGNFALTY